MKLTKIFSVILAIIMLLSTCIIANAAETKEVKTGVVTNATQPTLYAHGVSGNSEESEAWQKMQWNEIKGCNYFYLPSGAGNEAVEIYNNSTSDITIDSTKIPANTAVLFNYSTDKTYQVNINGKTSTLKFMKSTAEAAVYLNNLNADGNGKGLWQYLTEDKSNSATATGAIVGQDGSVDNTTVKKIKGRGNTTWYADKKPFNITYNEKVSIGGMESGKKYSFLANFQDASLSRNRFLYDLSDAVGMPYASDSRYVDFYVDGEYKGSYQAAQKVDTGSGNLLGKIDEEQSYLNEDGTLADNFAFVCEIDASASNEDYFFDSETGNKITLKVPELSSADAYYNEILDIAREKFDAMFFAVEENASNLNDLIDIESLAKLYLINELGKNWDSGVSSTFFVYKQNQDGNWKFYASPVWDYDNSLGNATGVQEDLRRMKVRDYTKPTGWWCEYKGKASYGDNILSYAATNPQVMDTSKKVWTQNFVPALEKFAGTGVDEGELYSSDVYYNYISDSADMNYTLGWALYTGGWICDHSSLNICTYNYETNTFTQSETATKYDTSTFKGEYDYAVDWMMSRAAWLSSELYDPSYVIHPTEEILVGDVDFDGDINVKDATLIQLYIANLSTFSNNTALDAADVDNSLDVDVKDATYIQLYCANMEAEGSIVGTTKQVLNNQ